MNASAYGMEMGGPGADAGRFARLIDRIEKRPTEAFAAFAILHLALWTLVPTLLCRNLPLDVLEGIAYGQHWQWGYWKHPPMPWLLDDLVRRMTAPHIWGFFLLGQVAAVACFWAIWRLGCEILRPVEALAATLLLDGCVTFNVATFEVNHNIIQLPFFGLAGWSLYRAFVGAKTLDWVLVGVWFAFAFYAKYTAATLLLPVLLFSIVDPTARRCWAGPGVYIAMAIFAALMAPHVIWLVGSDFSPIRFANEKATEVAGLASLVSSTAGFIGNALARDICTLLMFWIMLGRWWTLPNPVPPAERFAQRYLAVLAFGPLVISVAGGVLLQRHFTAGWASQFWCFTGLFLVAQWRPRIDAAALRRLVLAWSAFTLLMVASQVGAQAFLIGRGSLMSPQFPGAEFAAAVTAAWHKETGQPLSYVIGDDFEAGTVVLFSPDPVVAYHEANHDYMPWIDEADIRRRGAVLLWVSKDPRRPADFAAFAQAQPREPFVMRQPTLRGSGLDHPVGAAAPRRTMTGP